MLFLRRLKAYIVFTFLDSFRNKLDDLSVMAKQYCPEIICITESWLTSNIPDITVNLDIVYCC